MVFHFVWHQSPRYCFGISTACAIPVARNSAAIPDRSSFFIFAPALGFSFVPWPSPSPIVLVTMLHFSGLTICNAFLKRVELLARASILALIPIQVGPLSNLAPIPQVGQLCTVAFAFRFDAVIVVGAYYPEPRSLRRPQRHEHPRCQEQRSDTGYDCGFHGNATRLRGLVATLLFILATLLIVRLW